MRFKYFLLWCIWATVFCLGVWLIPIISENDYPSVGGLNLIEPVLWTGFAMALGLFYGGLLWCGLNSSSAESTDRLVSPVWLLCLVLLVHLALIFSKPILEDDYYRYSWDGKSIREGVHPYMYAPDEKINEQSPSYAHQINFPEYRSVYPPVLEVLFLSEVLYPNTIYGWWIFIFMVDVCLVLCWWYYHKHYHRGNWYLFLALWLNPIFLKEVLNSGHLDFFAGALLLVSFLFSQKFHQSKWEFIFYGLLVGVRPWYAAIIAWKIFEWKKKASLGYALIVVMPWVLFLSWPGLPSIVETMSSWQAFVQEWEFNALFYDWLSRLNLFFNWELESSLRRKIALLFGFSLLGFVFLLTRKQRPALPWSLLGVMLWLMCQPTVNAWYFIPIIMGLGGIYILKEHTEYLSWHMGVLASTAVALPMSYLNYLDLDGQLLDYKWSMAEFLLLALVFALFIFSRKSIDSKFIKSSA